MFHNFAKAIHKQFERISAAELFTVGYPDDAWAAYLAAFPEGTNPIYKTRTEHDCSCCRNFVKNIGNVIMITADQPETVWDAAGLEYPYSVVAEKMSAFVKAQKITGIFRPSEPTYGAETTVQKLPDGSAKRWDHFYGKVAKRHKSNQAPADIGAYSTTVALLKRGLEELKPSAVLEVIGMVKTNTLYRGEEHLAALESFKALQGLYAMCHDESAKSLFLWQHAASPFARFRNTVIGTLVQDLSEGVDTEVAVRSFETKVAPTNYKRPTALITPAMIKRAMEKVRELGLESALERRFATIKDVSVNNVLWVDNSVKSLMKGGLEEMLLSTVTAPVMRSAQVEDISIADFMANVLPNAVNLELSVGGEHLKNFMSLTAPVHADSKHLFKWQNDFGWSYDGNITDSIKEKVKAAGGNVTNAKLRVSLAWFNHDDLDIHVYEPNGNRIYYGNKSNKLDVDMNAGRGNTRTPVENVSWISPMDGVYSVKVVQFCQRESSDVGCVVEIENAGKIIQLSHAGGLREQTLFATLTLKGGAITGIEVPSGIKQQGLSQDKWGVKTESWAKVDTLMYSPNYWDDNAVGNKHWFFVLKGCKNPEATRGIYNEFLNGTLEEHRKVFEVLGDKTKCQPTADQLSGLGFSSTRGDNVTVKVTGAKVNKFFNIKF